ncbi:unnamed protein product [Chironomus riparius]|uniref:Uncharacterized protein n=1 Tax=Chironomus riparius TaxID=315576 RepID=A0A9N9S635_9DIPT|nr:unnamed protein product [Chironomus riparius]
MKTIKAFIITNLIYQTFAGGPGVPQSSFTVPTPCITCRKIFIDGEPPSNVDCDPGATAKVLTTVFFTTALGTVDGACTDPVVEITVFEKHNTISFFSTDVSMEFIPT